LKLIPTEISGPVIVELERRGDDRGFFARSFDAEEFRQFGMEPGIVQCNLSFNYEAGTLRGMHYQDETAPEAKLVRCTRGSIVDIIVDMRPDSPTRLQHVAVELTAENRLALYVPPLFAHGYQTLEPDTEVTYQVSGWYTPNAERGVRYNDPALSLSWPVPVSSTSEKDAAWPLLEQL
jgi:dTDP-4-dehydrorhamnose 3,5-epimerase